LNEVVKVEKLLSQDGPGIKDIWHTYHAAKRDAHGLALAGSVCTKVLLRAKSSPLMIFPVYKSPDAYLILLSQFQQNVFLFTYLDEYKKNPAAATPWLSLALYDDLATTKDVGLLRADFMPSVSKMEAEVLAEMVLDAYDTSFETTTELFNHKPQAFSFDSFIQATSLKFKSKYLRSS